MTKQINVLNAITKINSFTGEKLTIPIFTEIVESNEVLNNSFFKSYFKDENDQFIVQISHFDNPQVSRVSNEIKCIIDFIAEAITPDDKIKLEKIYKTMTTLEQSGYNPYDAGEWGLEFVDKKDYAKQIREITQKVLNEMMEIYYDKYLEEIKVKNDIKKDKENEAIKLIEEMLSEF